MQENLPGRPPDPLSVLRHYLRRVSPPNPKCFLRTYLSSIYTVYITFSVCICVCLLYMLKPVGGSRSRFACMVLTTQGRLQWVQVGIIFLAGIWANFINRACAMGNSLDDFTCRYTRPFGRKWPEWSFISASIDSPSSRGRGGPCSSQKWANRTLSIKNLNND